MSTRGTGLDTFANGGQLVDMSSWYAGRDKVQHAVLGFMLAVLCRRVGLARFLALLVVLIAAIAWECFEDARYARWRRAVRRWVNAGANRPLTSPPLPRFADPFSWRDVVATLAGALLALP